MTTKQALAAGAVVGAFGLGIGLALFNQQVMADTMVNAQSSLGVLDFGSIRPLPDGGYVCNLALIVPETLPDGVVIYRRETVQVEPCANACMPSVLTRAQNQLPY
jgi:hypothetical protein